MAEYQAYPKEADTKSRKARKGMRTKVFVSNKLANKKLVKARKDIRDAQAAAREEVVE